jgi:hypothetical protein
MLQGNTAIAAVLDQSVYRLGDGSLGVVEKRSCVLFLTPGLQQVVLQRGGWTEPDHIFLVWPRL